MNVRLEVMFESPGEEQMASLRSMARGLTNESASVRVFAGKDKGWLVVEFTMTTEAQYIAVEKIDRALRFRADDRWDSAISFPRTEAEEERARRKAEARRKRRREGDSRLLSE